MAKIKVGELKELKKNFPSEFEIHGFKGLDIEIKKYIPILEKIGFASSVYGSALNDDNGLHIVGQNEVDIMYKILLIKTYTNISLPKDTIEAYDLIVQSGIYNFVADKISIEEIMDLALVIENLIEEKKEIHKQEQDFTNIIKGLANQLIEKLPAVDDLDGIIEQATKAMEGFSPEKLEFVNEFMKKKGEKDGNNKDI